MATAKFIVQSSDANGNVYRNTISEINPTLMDGTQEERITNITAVDTGMRAVWGLSTNNYADTQYQVTFSVNEILEEEGN